MTKINVPIAGINSKKRKSESELLKSLNENLKKLKPEDSASDKLNILKPETDARTTIREHFPTENLEINPSLYLQHCDSEILSHDNLNNPVSSPDDLKKLLNEENLNDKIKSDINSTLNENNELYEKCLSAAKGIDDFQLITQKLHYLYLNKNHDYGDSFFKTWNKYGITSLLVRLNDKLNRLESLSNSDYLINESVSDTLMDIANYAILALIYLQPCSCSSPK